MEEVKGHPVEGIAEDGEGNLASTIIFVNVDKTPPFTEVHVQGMKGPFSPFEWYTKGYSFGAGYKSSEPVTLNLRGNDFYTDTNPTASGLAVEEYSVNKGAWQVYTEPVSFDDGEYSVRYRSIDKAGNVETANTIEFKIDQTPPTLTGPIKPSPNEYGWNKEDVDVSFSCEDSLSGFSGEIHNPPLISKEGEAQLESMGCYDVAGNKSEIFVTVNIDKTAPIISASTTTEDGKPYIPGTTANQPVIVQFNCFDALSGVDLCSGSQIFEDGMNQIAEGMVVDKAGNTTTISIDNINVDFTPPVATVHLSASSLSVTEDGTSDSYTITLSTRPIADVTVTLELNSEDIALSPDSAKLTFTPYNWDEPQTVTVTAVNDALVEIQEKANISHILFSKDVNYNGIAVNDLIVQITDNDIDNGTDNDTAGGNDTEDSETDSTEITPMAKSQPILSSEHTNITSTDGILTISLPVGAVEGGGRITVELVTDNILEELSAGRIRVSDQYYDVKIEDSAGNSILQLNEQIELSFHYDIEELPEDISRTDLRVFYWDEELNAWLTVPTKHHMENDAVIGTVDHLTVFSLLSAPDLDIPKDIRDHWSEADVLKLYSLNIINGYGDGTFRPEREVSRAEFIVLLARAFGLRHVEDPELNFTDTVPDWAAGYVAAAVQEGWVKGFTDGTFRADISITREQMLVLAVRAIGGGEPSSTLKFNDEADIADWAKLEVAKAVQMGLLIGYYDDHFRPQAKTTRAQTADIMLRLLRQLERE